MTEIPTASETRHWNGRVKRYGRCPWHPEILTSQFLGVNAAGWVFHCPKDGGHQFVNRPARHVEDERDFQNARRRSDGKR